MSLAKIMAILGLFFMGCAPCGQSSPEAPQPQGETESVSQTESRPVKEDPSTSPLLETRLLTIYEKPSDFPDDYVVREWKIQGRVNESTGQLDDFQMTSGEVFGKKGSLEEARKLIPDGWVRIGKFPGLEDPVIVESWTPQPGNPERNFANETTQPR